MDIKELFETYKTFTKINKKITDDKIISILNSIAHYTDYITILDCEFTSYMSLNMKYQGLNEELDGEKIRMVKFPREIGGVVFIKKEKEWILLGIFHFNLLFPHSINTCFKSERLRLVQSKYASVTDKTKQNMKNIEKKIFGDEKYILRFLNPNELKYNKQKQVLQGSHRIFIKNGGKYKKDIFGLYKLYIQDDDVQKRMISPSSTYKILNSFLTTKNTIVTKETMDLMVMRNYLLNLSHINRKKFQLIDEQFNHFDIKVFNGILREKFGNAKLENNFEGIKKLKSWNIFKSFFKDNFDKRIIVAHNPLTDAIYALAIALVMMYESKL